MATPVPNQSSNFHFVQKEQTYATKRVAAVDIVDGHLDLGIEFRDEKLSNYCGFLFHLGGSIIINELNTTVQSDCTALWASTVGVATPPTCLGTVETAGGHGVEYTA